MHRRARKLALSQCGVNHFSKTVEMLAAVDFRLSWIKHGDGKGIIFKELNQKENSEMRKERKLR